jgi:hypothetical protein
MVMVAIHGIEPPMSCMDGGISHTRETPNTAHEVEFSVVLYRRRKRARSERRRILIVVVGNVRLLSFHLLNLFTRIARGM